MPRSDGDMVSRKNMGTTSRYLAASRLLACVSIALSACHDNDHTEICAGAGCPDFDEPAAGGSSGTGGAGAGGESGVGGEGGSAGEGGSSGQGGSDLDAGIDATDQPDGSGGSNPDPDPPD